MKIILDCDPGHDDAIALTLLGSSDRFEVLGVTTTAGNQTAAKTTENALNVLSYLGLPYKVYRGAERPLFSEPVVCERIHGASGLDGFDFPPHNRRAEETHAAVFIADALKSSKEKVTLVTTGPMTNPALALRLDPHIADKIEKIVLMGGSIGAGNVTPAAEFNIHCDPEAAAICFGAGVPIYMIGLDVTRKALVTEEIIERMAKIGGKASEMFAALMKTFLFNQKKVFGLNGAPLHDPVTVASLLHPELLRFEYVHAEIDTGNTSSRGRTNCDLPHYLNLEKNAHVAVDIDCALFFDVIEEALRSYGETAKNTRAPLFG